MEEEKKETMHKICEQVEELIGKISEEGIQADNVELLGDLVDIHKDIANEKYWDVKKEGIKMRYNREYDEYNEGSYGRRGRDSRGRYTGRGMMHEGEEMIEEMLFKAQMSQTLKYGIVIVASLPMMMIYPFIQKHFVKGVLIGSVKG